MKQDKPKISAFLINQQMLCNYSSMNILNTGQKQETLETKLTKLIQ